VGGPRGADRPGRAPRPPARAWVRAAGWGLVALFAAIALAVALLPVPAGGSAAPTLVYDEAGQPFATLPPGNRRSVPLEAVPLALQEATVATEDAEFYVHHGLNPAAVLRALWVDVRAGAPVQGGSTITQQLAKTLFLTPSRTVGRKLLELLYTLRLEATYSKAQILEMYLNSIYYGEGAYGVAAAAETYFGQDVSTLDLAQSALLAGLPNAPTAYDPYTHPDAARQRQLWVLHRMVVTGYITEAQAAAAAAETLHFTRGAAAVAPAAGYFLGYVLDEIGRHDPRLESAVRKGGYRIYTTLDPTLQAAADRAIQRGLPPGRPDRSGVLQPEGALVAIDPGTGAVRALVGGRSDVLDPFNRALYAKRQPGSTFKPFLYAAALEAGHTVVERKYDGPVSYPGAGGRPYVVKDFGDYTFRWLTMREALAISDNVVAVKWAADIGPARVIRTARRMGITSPLQPTLPLVLGAYDVTPLELTSAYVPLANLGTAYPPWCVVRVEDAAGRTVWAPSPPRGRAALDPGVAYIVTSMLESVMTDGTGRSLLPGIDRPVAGKTGSTNDQRDAWFVGYTPDLVVGVWVGDDQPAPLGGYGADLAGPVWRSLMLQVLPALPARDWAMPADVVPVQVSAVDGLLPNPTSPVVTELFLRGTEPTEVSPVYDPGAQPAGLIGVPGSQVAPPLLGTPPLPAAQPPAAGGPGAEAGASAPGPPAG
jgi:1A family penicillin-binding protein